MYFNPRSPRGGATDNSVKFTLYFIISIHAPREGERPQPYLTSLIACKFQSTLPARGSDYHINMQQSSVLHFNPRSPRGGATSFELEYIVHIVISIHAPREGERLSGGLVLWRIIKFQSTLPARGSDGRIPPSIGSVTGISIHAPREGERRTIIDNPTLIQVFQSTLPARGSDR